MKADKKAERLAALFGIEAPKPISGAEYRRRANVSREAEAVILYAESPAKFLERPCKTCQRIFAVNRSHIAFCSDFCRGEYLNNVMGLDWDPNGRTPEERWTPQTGGIEPLIVPPHVLPLVQERFPARVETAPTQDEFDLPDIDALLAE